MWWLPDNTYARWRCESWPTPALHEPPPEGPPKERWLQLIWFHQRIQRDELATLDGRRLRVLHPGFWNREAGPDFRRAVLQFDDEPAQSGDIEVDPRPGDWKAHRHEANAEYARVILQVVWEAERAPAAGRPLLALRPILDAPLPELVQGLTGDDARALPAALAGKCRLRLAAGLGEPLQCLLRQAAEVRLQTKAAQVQARARQVGWEQSLWESLFAALGYKANVWPMRRLAELIPRLTAGPPPGQPQDVRRLQACLWGIGALLPTDLVFGARGARAYLREVWDGWWRERAAWVDVQLPRSLWRLGGVRPANHPARRLALAAQWLGRGSLPARLETWLTTAASPAEAATSLLGLLQGEPDDFWSWRWTFQSGRLSRPQPLLGASRATDLAVNAVLPWLWARAAVGRNHTLKAAAEERYFTWPRAQDNAVLKLARERLLGCGSARVLPTAAAQQGLLQIVRDFCDQSNAVCEGCRLPALLEGG